MLLQRLVRSLLRLLFGFRTFNAEVLRAPGPVLLIPNHQSLLDWLLLGVCLEPDWKFVVSSVTAQTNWLFRRVMLNRRTFPIDTLSPYAARHMAEYLQKGGRLVLFAEGRISRTGSLMKLFEGTGFLLHKTRAQVITAHLRGTEQLRIFTIHPNRKRWFPRITAHFSPLLQPPLVEHVRSTDARSRLTTWLRDRMIAQQFQAETDLGPRSVPEAIATTARWRARQVAFEDATRKPITYRQLLIGSDLFARIWSRTLQPSDGNRVGVLLPNVGATPIVLQSLWLAGRVPAILNYSTGPTILLACTQLAGLRQVITSRAFLERARLDIAPLTAAGIELLYLEDLRARITRGAKLAAAIRAAFAPKPAPSHPQLSPSAPAAILFTSGSEGVPKAVELTHANLLANVRQMLAVIDLNDRDRLFNAMPLFHSFGLTVGTLLPLIRGIYVFIYPSPLHYRVVPTVLYDRDCTVMLGTNTFLNGYARRAHPYDFHRLRLLFAGAEKIQEATANAWARKFGVRILEGFGATECSPVISVNVPMAAQPGTTGRLLPGIEIRLDPIDGVPEGGRIFVKGPNVMRGYLNPEPNAAFQALNGWYDTGDIGRFDVDGFLHLLGRLKRFAKVSGEMVSLTTVEDALAGAFPHLGLRCEVAVLARPDPDKGEILIAVTNEKRVTLDAIRAAIRARGLSNLATPRELVVVSEIPKLGTGKTNHRELAAAILPH